MKTNDQVNGTSRRAFVRALALGLPLLSAGTLKAQIAPVAPERSVQFDPGNLRAFVELARSDIRTQKTLILAQVMDFTEPEAAEFWPLHRSYDAELNQLLDQRFALVAQFARQYKTMTDKQAAELAAKAFDLEAGRTKLRRKYFKRFLAAVPARKAARFFQVENQLNMAVDLRLAAALPLIK